MSDLTQRRQTAAIEGPTRAQVTRARALRARLVAEAETHRAAGRYDRALACDERVFDLDVDFAGYANLT